MGSLGVKFWGTRGLVSSPRPETAIFGGNTPSVQVLYRDHLVLIDTGFGCANIGDELMARILQRRERLTIHIFYTHFHWDHVQGLPFFKPIYFDSTTLNIYAPCATEHTLQNLDILFDGSYSPFESLMTMQAKVNLHQLSGALELDGMRISYQAVDHGISLPHEDCYAYRIEAEGESVTLITDHEARNSQKNKDLVDFAAGSDLLIHDGQYTAEEYLKRKGEGHSSVEQALDNARKTGAKLTLLTHHDPSRNDKDLQALHRAMMRIPRFRPVRFEFAREEIVYAVARAKTLSEAG